MCQTRSGPRPKLKQRVVITSEIEAGAGSRSAPIGAPPLDEESYFSGGGYRPSEKSPGSALIHSRAHPGVRHPGRYVLPRSWLHALRRWPSPDSAQVVDGRLLSRPLGNVGSRPLAASFRRWKRPRRSRRPMSGKGCSPSSPDNATADARHRLSLGSRLMVGFQSGPCATGASMIRTCRYSPSMRFRIEGRRKPEPYPSVLASSVGRGRGPRSRRLYPSVVRARVILGNPLHSRPRKATPTWRRPSRETSAR